MRFKGIWWGFSTTDSALGSIEVKAVKPFRLKTLADYG